MMHPRNHVGHQTPARLRGQAQSQIGSAAIAMAQGDDVLALGVDLRQQHRGFVGFRAAVGEKRFFQSPGRDLRELFRQTHLRLVGIERRHMLNLVSLLVDRLGDSIVAVADADGENAAEEVEKLPPVGVINVLILRVVDHQRLVVISGHAREEIFFLLFEDFVFVHEARPAVRSMTAQEI